MVCSGRSPSSVRSISCSPSSCGDFASWARWLTTTLAIISLGFLHVLARWVPALTLLDRFTPQFLALFVFGMVATAAARSINAPRYAAWAGQALFFLFFLGCVAFGSRTIVEQYFWIDLLVGAATTLVFIAIMGGRLNPVRKVLAARPLAFVGQFAFSLYLIHAPILDLARTHIISPLGWTGVRRPSSAC